MDEFGLTPAGHFAQSDVFWWLHAKGNAPKVLAALNNDFQVVTNQNERIAAYDTYASLYSNRNINSGAPLLTAYQGAWAVDAGKYTRCPYNLMKQVIDEVTSRIIKTHPRARFITTGGDETMQRQALMMERWNDAQVYKLHQSEKFEHVIQDACIYGLGALKITKAYKEDRLDSQRIHPGNLFVDLQETMFDQPTRLHHRRYVSKNSLKMFFPKKAQEIESSGTISTHETYTNLYGLNALELVEVVESWHLPSYEGADDGKRFLWVQNAILQSSDYQRRHFPFAFFTWKPDTQNTFYGTGLGSDLFGVHIDANVTLNRVNTAIEFASVPQFVYRLGSVTETDITNAPGKKIPYTGDIPPQFLVPNSVPQDLLMYVREHESRAYKIAGLTSAQAFGERMPSGLETGRAVENFFNVESVPFSTQLRKFEYFVEDVANCNVAGGRDIYEANPKWSVVVPGERNTIEVVKWKDVAIDPREDSYVIRAAPASALSELPAARLGEVERLSMMFPGMPDAMKADLLRMPDIANWEDLFTAAKDNGKAMIDQALRTGVFTPPSPFMNLQQFIIDCNEAEQRASRMGVKEQNLSTLRRMLRRANELQQEQTIAKAMQNQGAITPTAVPTDSSGVSPTARQAG